MSLTGLEQMAHLARQADVGQMQANEKQSRRVLKHKEEELAQQKRIERSQAVASMNESDKIEALADEDRHEDRGSNRKRSDQEESQKQKRQYYNDPSVGGHIDISS